MLITVFTPTYNRANLLPRLYESLCKQTFHDFEWLIVDDGSSDGTNAIVEMFKNDGKIRIRYIWQENSGKYRAINKGVTEAQGELFFIADSDDMLMENSLSEVADIWDTVKDNSEFGGVCGLDQLFNGEIIGGGLPQDIIDCTPLEIVYKYKIHGDKKEVFRTSAFSEFPFPEVSGEKFCSESLVWNRFSTKYKLRYFNKPIYKVEYQSHGLTASSIHIRMNSPILTLMTYSEMLTYKIPLKAKIRAAINYYRFSTKSDSLEKSKINWRWILLKPIGVLMHLNDLRVIKK